MRRAWFALVLAAVAALAAGPAAAAACDDPAWDTATIISSLSAAMPAEAGTTYERKGGPGFVLALAPVADVAFALPPERAPRNPEPRGAVLHFAAGEAGAYRVALSARAWIDIVQDGAPLRSGAHTDLADCRELHKIVTFDIGPGPFTLQLSDAVEPSIRAAVTRAP
jgi:hypothetical protein